MPIRDLLAVALVAASLAGATIAGQQPSPSPAGATGRVSGDVVDGNGQRVRDVTVVLFPVDEQHWTPADVRAKLVQAVSLASGAFAMSDLPAGDYRLNVTREPIAADGPDAALIKTLVPRSFPIQVSGGDQKQIRLVVDAGAKIVRAQMAAMTQIRSSSEGGSTLPPGSTGAGRPATIPPGPTGPGAISGVVTDADGKPVAGLDLQRMVRLARNGEPTLAPTGRSTTTDERGAYRFDGLVAGEYVVAALAYATDFAGPGAPQVSHMPAPVVDASGWRLGSVTTYYPGTAVPAEAEAVSVGRTEVPGINFSLQRKALGELRGTIAVTSALELSDHVYLQPADMAALTTESRRAPVELDGHFAFADVPVGKYVLRVSTTAGWAFRAVDVIAAPADPVMVLLRAPLVVKGHVELLADDPLPAAVFASLRIRIAPAALVPGDRIVEGAVSPSGEFTLPGIAAGRYILQLRASPPWTEISGMLGGRDTLDVPVDVTESRDDAVVVIADREAGVRGTVRDEAGSVVNDALVVIYSADRQFWSSGSRRVRPTHVVPGGGFTVASLPPGDYVAIALGGNSPPVTNALLARYLTTAQPFHLVAREHLTLDLRLRKPGGTPSR
jgi:hypothetical protein